MAINFLMNDHFIDQRKTTLNNPLQVSKILQSTSNAQVIEYIYNVHVQFPHLMHLYFTDVWLNSWDQTCFNFFLDGNPFSLSFIGLSVGFGFTINLAGWGSHTYISLVCSARCPGLLCMGNKRCPRMGSLGWGLTCVSCTSYTTGERVSMIFVCMLGRSGDEGLLRCVCGIITMGFILMISTGIQRGFIVNRVGFRGQGVSEGTVLLVVRLLFLLWAPLTSLPVDCELFVCDTAWTLCGSVCFEVPGWLSSAFWLEDEVCLGVDCWVLFEFLG